MLLIGPQIRPTRSEIVLLRVFARLQCVHPVVWLEGFIVITAWLRKLCARKQSSRFVFIGSRIDVASLILFTTSVAVPVASEVWCRWHQVIVNDDAIVWIRTRQLGVCSAWVILFKNFLTLHCLDYHHIIVVKVCVLKLAWELVAAAVVIFVLFMSGFLRMRFRWSNIVSSLWWLIVNLIIIIVMHQVSVAVAFVKFLISAAHVVTSISLIAYQRIHFPARLFHSTVFLLHCAHLLIRLFLLFQSLIILVLLIEIDRNEVAMLPQCHSLQDVFRLAEAPERFVSLHCRRVNIETVVKISIWIS